MPTLYIISSADKNYGQHIGVMILSLLKNNSNENKVNITILDGGILNSDKEKIKKLCLEYQSDVSFIPVDTYNLTPSRIDGHISVATYYRIIIPEVIPKSVKKVIYLDADIIVTDSLIQLYTLDMENISVAAVQDTGVTDTSYIKKIGLPGPEFYFNAGVLLINLEWWRKNSVGKKLKDYICGDPSLLKTWDQDALNSILWDSAKIVDPKFNFITHFLNPSLHGIYLKTQIADAYKKPVIIHYNTADKPWYRFCQNPLKKYYWHYLKQSPWNEYTPPKVSIIHLTKQYIILNSPKLLLNIYQKIKREKRKKLSQR